MPASFLEKSIVMKSWLPMFSYTLKVKEHDEFARVSIPHKYSEVVLGMQENHRKVL